VELAVRKLLVASQKSDVGKTTTSINLAAGAAVAGARVLLVETDPLNNVSSALNLGQHPERKPLRQAGIDLPGVLCCGVIEGLDVFSPYEEGSCNDDDLDRLLQLLSLDAFKESYDCLIINAPPFFGGRPAPLLACADEFLVVMQAEPMAYRTMPAFLEMVQRASKGEAHAARMRGILLTLPETETIGGRWERELRGRFGGRVMAQVIPHDEEVGKATLFGHVVLHASPEAPASVAYQELVGELQLARDAKKAGRPVEATLTLAAAAVRDNPPAPRAPVAPLGPRKSSARVPRVRVSSTSSLRADSPAEPRPPEVIPPAAPIAPSHVAASHSDEPVKSHHQDQPPPLPLHSSSRPWLIWVGLSVVAGVGLRFVQMPDFALPMIVGLAVAAGVTLFLHLFTQASEQSPAPEPTPTPPPKEHISGPHKKYTKR
jgi:chromosome partitioning protein